MSMGLYVGLGLPEWTALVTACGGERSLLVLGSQATRRRWRHGEGASAQRRETTLLASLDASQRATETEDAYKRREEKSFSLAC